MTVYLDKARNPFGGMRMCHMIADSTAELLTMADKIGVDRRWIQHAGTWREHFDIAQSKRVLAIAAGAVSITSRELVRKIKARREATALVHVLEHGRPLCGFSSEVPADWPPEHRWIGRGEFNYWRRLGQPCPSGELCVPCRSLAVDT